MSLRNLIFTRLYGMAPKNSTKPIFKKFKKKIEKNLLLVNMSSSAVLVGIGDLIAQKLEYKDEMMDICYDWRRFANMTFIGLSVGFVSTHFYNWLDQRYAIKMLETVVKKILLDQLLMAPFSITFSIITLNYLNGKSTDQILNLLKPKFVQLYTMDWCIWPAVQFINFYFLPLRYRVLFISSFTTLYNVYLSFIIHEKEKKTRIKTK